MRQFHLLILFLAFTLNAAAQNCSVSISYTVNGNTVIATANPVNAFNPLYSWYDPTTNNFTSPSPNSSYTFTFPSSGSIYSCVWMYDSINQCNDSACFTAYQQNICDASFYTFDSLNTTFFVNTSLADSGSVFQWDFGDGGFSYDADPSYSYATAGIYNVCLYIWSPLSLMPCDSFCTQIQITYLSQTGITENEILVGGITTWPNPSADNINVSWQQQETGKATPVLR